METNTSREKRKNNEIDFHLCSVSYRILPSELNKFVRIFGDNDWVYPFFEHKSFKSEDDFKKFISEWKTYGEWKKYNDKNNGILWYEPSRD